MKSKLPLLMILLLICYFPANAVDLTHSTLELGIQSARNNNTISYGGSDEGQITDDDYFDFGFDEDESIYDYDYKSPKKAFLYSLIIPGWGQRYTGANTLKTLAFFAIEAGSWMGYFSYHNDGTKKTDEFEAFANEHWTEGVMNIDSVYEPSESYRAWLDNLGKTEEDFTHILPSIKDQQYYEMIGKYDQFRAGWDDYWSDPAFYEDSLADGTILNISPNRLTYNTMRKDANDLLDKANTFVLVAVANRLLSAFDAALSARRYNRGKAAELWLSVRAEMKQYTATETIPMLKFSLKF